MAQALLLVSHLPRPGDVVALAAAFFVFIFGIVYPFLALLPLGFSRSDIVRPSIARASPR